jgi:hypothetical protein
MHFVIRGSSSHCKEEFPKVKHRLSKIKKVTVFFDNDNFLITDLYPKTENVHLIIEDTEENQLHIEGANCGYDGEGPRTTMWILKEFGIPEEQTEKLLFFNQGLTFQVDLNGNIIDSSVNCEYLISSSFDKRPYGKIRKDPTSEIDLTRRTIRLFNPQFNCFDGLLYAIHKMELYQLEYYIGRQSPIDNAYRFQIDHTPLKWMSRKDKKEYHFDSGLTHVNLAFRGKRFRVFCVISKDYEVQTIIGLFQSLVGENLNEDFLKRYYSAKRRLFFRPRFLPELHDILTRQEKKNELDEEWHHDW